METHDAYGTRLFLLRDDNERFANARSRRCIKILVYDQKTAALSASELRLKRVTVRHLRVVGALKATVCKGP